MPECDRCGVADGLAHTCNYCGGRYCPKHVLPENHRCAGLRRANTLGRDLRPDESSRLLGIPDVIRRLGSGSAEDEPAPRSSTVEYEGSPGVADDGSVVGRGGEDAEGGSGTGGWLRRVASGATAGKHYRGDCPNCGRWVRTLANDRYTSCHRCGWKAGLPLVRVVTHWPNWYRWRRWGVRWGRRTTYALVVASLLAFVVGASVGTGIAPVDEAARDVAGAAGIAGPLDDSVGTVLDGATAEPRPDADGEEPGGSGTDSTALSRAGVEWLVHEEMNERRRAHGLAPTAFDTRLRDIARGHSAVMAAHGTIFHTQPDGDTFGDRYDAAGYDCRVPVGDRRYATGAENVAKTWYRMRVRADSGTDFYRTPAELATGLVDQWMNSTGHRENILRPFWNREGIGIAIVEEGGRTAVYATQNFC